MWILAGLWLGYAWMVRRFWFVTDDAYISFRYARHLGAGHGLVWNPGEAPVEGFTNLLLVILVAPFTRLGLDPRTMQHHEKSAMKIVMTM